MAKLVLAFLVHCAFAIIRSSATTYTVGDSSGWDISTNLETWVQDKKFKVGDALVFQYSSSESVDEVTRENYKTCNTNKVLAAYGNGNTTVPLTKPGDRYFVTGNKLYCLGGMKLHVHVEGDSAYSPAPAPGKAALAPVAGSDNGASETSKKNTPQANGAVNCGMDITVQLVALMMVSVLWVFQI